MLADICGEEQLSGLLEVTREDAAEYIAQAKRTSHAADADARSLLASETDMKWAAQPRFALKPPRFAPARAGGKHAGGGTLCRVDELERKLREGVVTAAPARKQAAAAPAADAPEAAQEKPRRPPRRKRRKACAGRGTHLAGGHAAKQKPQLFGMLKFGRLVSGENGLFTVVYPKAMGAAYVKMLRHPEELEVAGYLTQAAATRARSARRSRARCRNRTRRFSARRRKPESRRKTA